MKTTLISIVIIFGIVVMGFLYQIKLRDSNIEDLELKNSVIMSRKSALDKKFFASMSVNILILNNMNKRDQERLQKNEEYLDLLDELN
jgi:hypothetical protein